jgi:hypothetical protein
VQKLLLIRFAIRELVLPSLAGLVGIFLSVYLPVSGHFEPWQLPLLAGLLGTPLVAIGGDKKKNGAA